MRQLRFRRALALVSAVALAMAVPRVGRAQTGLAQEGALFLLLPVGARSVGLGQAVVADRSGSELVWWNPAAIGAATRREAAIHHSQSVAGTGDAVTIVVPSSLLGVLALSVNIFDYGEQEATSSGEQNPEGAGTIIPRSLVYAATYATPLGSNITAGITYKLVQFRIDCTGPCPSDVSFSATTSALDLGAQFTVKRSIPLVIGIAARNVVGIKLQVNDSPQADKIPKRLQVGMQYRLDVPPKVVPETAVRLAFDVADEVTLGDPVPRFGADVAFRERFHLRAGYAFEASGSEAGGPSIGLGLTAGNLVFDFARVLAGLSADAGKAPTYLSLRYLF